MTANAVTLSRIPLLGFILYLLYQPHPTWRLIAAPLIFILIILDTVDGILARAWKETSLLGSVLDIAADRAVEYALWIMFAHLRLIPVLIPLLVVIRGTFVDTIRSVAPTRGTTPFEMMQTKLGRFLVKSAWMRTGYGIAKGTAFVLLAWAHGALTAGQAAGPGLHLAAQIAAWIALVICLARGLPVLMEAPRALQEPPKQNS